MRLQTAIIEQNLSDLITYEIYEEILPHIFDESYSIEEGLGEFLKGVKDATLSKLKGVFMGIKTELEDIARDGGASVEHLIQGFKNKDIFHILKAFGFSIKALLKSVDKLGKLVQQGLFKTFKKIHETGLFKKLEQGVITFDEIVDKYPILNRVTGVVVAGLLFFIWTQMTFIGRLDYDFDFTHTLEALKGNFSLADLFASPQGLMLMTLFMTGGLISVPWLGSTMSNLVLALSYTGYKRIKEKGVNLDKLKRKFKVA